MQEDVSFYTYGIQINIGNKEQQAMRGREKEGGGGGGGGG